MWVAVRVCASERGPAVASQEMPTSSRAQTAPSSKVSVVNVERMFGAMPLEQVSSCGGTTRESEQTPMIGAPAGSSGVEGKSLELRSTEAIERTSTQLRNVSMILLASVILLLLFMLTLCVMFGMLMTRLNETLDEISETISPATLSAAVHTIQASLENGLKTSNNVLDFSTDIASTGMVITQALNTTGQLIERGNEVALKLLEHPTLTVALGTR
jgi:hypothetical protein